MSFWKKVKQTKIPEPDVTMFSSPKAYRAYLDKCKGWGAKALQTYWDFENIYKQINELEVNKDMADNYIVINGKRAELTKEQLEQLGIEVKLERGPYQQLSYNKNHFIDATGKISTYYQRTYTAGEQARFDSFNSFTDSDLAQQVAWHQELDRKLWNFSFLNNWSSEKIGCGFYIRWHPNGSREFSVVQTEWGTPYCPIFVSEMAARQAIEEVIEPFMKEHPNFYWGM